MDYVGYYVVHVDLFQKKVVLNMLILLH